MKIQEVQIAVRITIVHAANSQRCLLPKNLKDLQIIQPLMCSSSCNAAKISLVKSKPLNGLLVQFTQTLHIRHRAPNARRLHQKVAITHSNKKKSKCSHWSSKGNCSKHLDLGKDHQNNTTLAHIANFIFHFFMTDDINYLKRKGRKESSR